MSEKWSRSSQCHDLNKFGSTLIPDAVYQVSMSSTSWVWRRRFLKVFTIYGSGSHLGHVTQNIWTNFHPNIPWRLHMKFGFKGLVFLEEKKFENVESERPWTKINGWPWVVLNPHILIYLTICTNFHLTDFHSFLEIYNLNIFPYKNKRDQIWHCCKVGQGQPMVIIWTNLIVLE